METSRQAVELADEAMGAASRPECAYYSSQLLQKAQDDSVPEEVRRFLKVLGQVASYHFRHENTQEPFGPVFQSSDGRSAIPADLTDDDLENLEELCSVISATELLARSYDVLWLRKRRPEFAKNAISSYIAGAKEHFDLEHWTFCVELAERALRLASLFRRQSPEVFEPAAELLLRWIMDHSGKDEKFLTARSIRLLLQFNHGDPEQLLDRAREVGERARERGDFHCAEEYWRQAVKCARAADNEEAANSSQAELAQCYVENARLNKGSGMSAAHWMQQAIEAYKAVPGTQAKREELYAELRGYQRESLKEMGKFETSFDISDLLRWTTELITGREESRDVLFAFAFGLAQPLDYSKLEKQARDIAAKHPLSSMFPAVHLDDEGKVVARTEGSFGSSDGVSNAEIYRLAGMEHQLVVAGKILPAIDIITHEHDITEHELLGMLENNPFIAQGQEPLFAKGLHAGFHQDYVVALSILIPLLENSIRLVLSAQGVRTSTLNSHGVQEVLRMGAILDHEKTAEVFGENTVRDLQGLLVERAYGNLRNNISHGLLTEGGFYQHSSIYLWWLTLRLCLTPVYVAEQQIKPDDKEQHPESGEDKMAGGSE